LGDCFLWVAFLQIAEIAQIIGLLISTVKVLFLILEKNWLSYFVPFFSLAHPVTLI
jgi:hypothetical protein